MQGFNYNQFTKLEWKILKALSGDLKDTCPNLNGLRYYLDIPISDKDFTELNEALANLKSAGYLVVGMGFLAGDVFSLKSARLTEVRDLVSLYENAGLLDTAFNMKKYGGSFVRALGELVLHADPNNLAKLKDTFSDYFDEYHPTKWSAKNG